MDISGLLLWPRKQFRLFFKILLDIWSPQGFEANRVSIVLVAVREIEVEIQIEISLLVPARPRGWMEVGAGGTRVRILGTLAVRRGTGLILQTRKLEILAKFITKHDSQTVNKSHFNIS